MNILLRQSLYLLVVSAVTAEALLSMGCGGKSDIKVSAAGSPPAVVLAEVAQRTVPIYSEFVGQTRANETVELRARVEGILEKIYFKEGTEVKKGDLLFTIDKRPFDAAVQSARAVLAKAKSDLAQAEQRTDSLERTDVYADEDHPVPLVKPG